ncbi:glycosyl transferase [Thiopseudomonas alkaliphila]|uniref:glycosyltransferase family 4 protein n=1 Tax=Thiopseudomonas alkaliphila TaxID=1697053 RepID=UPI00069F7776|nr:glycosyltransferase family 4 protein [Thiopseudomonas alkaliphila]AKX49192.1 glycosyl transferase [Thiopseudomonas alkaliphila]
MNVLIVASLAGSLVGFRKPLIVFLISKGFVVHVAAPELLNNKKVMTELVPLGVFMHDLSMSRTGISPTQDFKTVISLWRLMIKVKPNAVLSYTIKPVIYGTLAAWLARVPKRFALITGLGYAFQESTDSKRSIVKKIAHGLYKLALSKSHTTFFQNPDDEQLFKQLGILKKSANTVVVNGSGVGLEDYPLASLPEYKYPRFLFIGRLLGDKGVREYAEATQLVKKQYPSVEFDLVGRIDINPNAIKQKELDKWIADGQLNYFGQLKDVKPRIAACSVYVLPSYREGTPRSVLEAMSMGRAIITTDAPGCRETVVNGVNGYLVPVQNSKALAEAMIKLIENPELIASMAAESRRIAEEKYDVNIVNEQMIKGMGL